MIVILPLNQIKYEFIVTVLTVQVECSRIFLWELYLKMYKSSILVYFV